MRLILTVILFVISINFLALAEEAIDVPLRPKMEIAKNCKLPTQEIPMPKVGGFMRRLERLNFQPLGKDCIVLSKQRWTEVFERTCQYTASLKNKECYQTTTDTSYLVDQTLTEQTSIPGYTEVCWACDFP